MKKLLIIAVVLSIIFLICCRSEAGVVELTTPAQVKKEFAKKGPFVVLYYTQWCGACKSYKPEYRRESENFPNVRFYRMDVDKIQVKEHQKKVPFIPMLFYGKDEQTFRNDPCIAKNGERSKLKAFFERCSK